MCVPKTARRLGMWSPTWTFTAGGPAPPHSVRSKLNPAELEASSAGQQIPGAQSPRRTASTAAARRASPQATLHTRSPWVYLRICHLSSPPNFVAETSNTELEVFGPGVKAIEGEQGLLPGRGRRRRRRIVAGLPTTLLRRARFWSARPCPSQRKSIRYPLWRSDRSAICGPGS